MLLPISLYSADVAQAAAASFPALTGLALCGGLGMTLADNKADSDHVAQGLAAANGQAAANGSATAGAGSRATGGLQRLSAPLTVVTRSLGDALSSMPQLKELCFLSIDLKTAKSPAAAQLSRLTQLQKLALGPCSTAGIEAVLPALTGLTELSFSAASFAPLCLQAPAPSIQKLSLGGGTLDVASFAQLPALQSLDALGLSASGPPPSGGWRLPQQLETLSLVHLDARCIKVLSQLRVPRDCKLSVRGHEVGVTLDGELCVANGSALSADGEAALCRALRFLGQYWTAGVRWHVEAHGSQRLLPVGGLDGVGPGRRNHSWLAELGGQKGATSVLLRGFQLSAQDLELLSRQDNLRSLDLGTCAIHPLSALPLLGRSRSLTELFLDVGDLIGFNAAEAGGSEEAAAKAGALRTAIVGLYMVSGWRGQLLLTETPSRSPRVVAELEAAQQDLRAAGVVADIEIEEAYGGSESESD
jgi:hypothetical protein